MAKRIAVILISISLILSACSFPYKEPGSYLWREKIAGEGGVTTFSFPATLKKLYPSATAIVTGMVRKLTSDTYDVNVTDTLDGYIPSGTVMVYSAAADSLEDGASYLLFLAGHNDQTEHSGVDYDLLIPETGNMKMGGNLVYPVPGVTLELESVRADINNLRQRVSAPPSYSYHQTLESLVQGSSMVFLGTVSKIETDVPLNYYVREDGFEELSSELTTRITLLPTQMFKGEETESVTVLLAPSMLINTVSDQTLENTRYTDADLPKLYIGVTHLFFLIDSPGGKRGSARFFVNPVQGYVPLVADNKLSPIPINEVFSMQEDAVAISYEIRNIVRMQELDSGFHDSE